MKLFVGISAKVLAGKSYIIDAKEMMINLIKSKSNMACFLLLRFKDEEYSYLRME